MARTSRKGASKAFLKALEKSRNTPRPRAFQGGSGDTFLLKQSASGRIFVEVAEIPDDKPTESAEKDAREMTKLLESLQTKTSSLDWAQNLLTEHCHASF